MIGRPVSRLAHVLIWAVIGAVLAIAAILLWSQQRERTLVVQPLPVDATIAVDVRGGVATPGVALLPGNARVADAVAAAGGLTADADVSRINLAARLADGQRLSIPTGGQPVALASSPATTDSGEQTGPATVPEPTGTSSARLVNLNTATAVELKSLPGIGDVLAGRIVEYRDANGPFRTVDQLREVRGVSAKLVENIRPLVTVDG